jgi:hypothetical protein
VIAYCIGLMLAGCVDGSGATGGADDSADPGPPILDECPPCIDVATCIANDVRIQECKLLCSALDLRCSPDGDGSSCWAECFAHESGTHYCPFGAL